MKKLTTEEFIEKAKSIHGDKYDYSQVEYSNKYTPIKIFCKICKHWFIQNPRNHLVCKQCPSCKKDLSIQTNIFVVKAKQIHGNKYGYDKVIYTKNRVKVKIFCNKCNKYFKQTPESHLQGCGCPICGKVIKKTKNNFIKEAKKIHKNKYNYNEIQYINSHKKIKLYCNTCKQYFWQIPINHLHGSGCPYCNPYKKLTQAEFIEKAKEIHNDIYDYSEVCYKNHRTKIKIRCKRCGILFEQKVNCHLNGQGCPYCKQSKGELQIQAWLEKHTIIYEAQKRFKDCRDKNPLPFDFYLPCYNLCIEYQGRQHYKEGFDIFAKRYEDQEKAVQAFKKQQRRDRIKQKYCKINNILFLKIKYSQDIEKTLKQEFNLLLSNM